MVRARSISRPAMNTRSGDQTTTGAHKGNPGRNLGMMVAGRGKDENGDSPVRLREQTVRRRHRPTGESLGRGRARVPSLRNPVAHKAIVGAKTRRQPAAGCQAGADRFCAHRPAGWWSSGHRHRQTLARQHVPAITCDGGAGSGAPNEPGSRPGPALHLGRSGAGPPGLARYATQDVIRPRYDDRGLMRSARAVSFRQAQWWADSRPARPRNSRSRLP